MNVIELFSDNRKVNVFFSKRKSFLAIITLCLSSFSLCNAQDSSVADILQEGSVSAVADNNVPLLLGGVWQNSNRYVVFNEVPNVVLRTFYQWYNDRAAESKTYSSEHKLDRNNTTSQVPEQIELHFTPLTDELFTKDYNMPVIKENGDTVVAENLPSGAWDVEVKYSGKKIGGESSYHVPVAIVGDKLYLNFAIKKDDTDSVPQSELLSDITIQSENLLEGYWQGFANANGILVSPPVISNEIKSCYVTNNNVYYIRYWKTDMDYDKDAKAFFTDGDKTYSVPKMIFSSGKTYTCTVGRRTQIRDVKKSSEMAETYSINSVLVEKNMQRQDGSSTSYTVRTATICTFGEPYLTLCSDTRTLEDIVSQQNAKKKPAPPPLFPPHGVLDFDWSIIEDPPASWDRRVLDLGK